MRNKEHQRIADNISLTYGLDKVEKSNNTENNFTETEVEVFDSLMKSQSEEQNEKVKKVMDEWKEGKLETSTGELVTDRKQALAIALSEVGLEKSFNDELEKSKVALTGEIHTWNGKKYKKQANGKWLEVSEHGMTKEEHFKEGEKVRANPFDRSSKREKDFTKHYDSVNKLSDKEHSDEEVGISSSKYKVLDSYSNYKSYEDIVEQEGENYADALRNVDRIEEEYGEFTLENAKKWVEQGEDETGWGGDLNSLVKFLEEQKVISKENK